MRDKSGDVKTATTFVVLGGMVLCGCGVAHNVAVSSFRVIDAPAHYVRKHIDDQDSSTTTTTTTTYAASDSVTPGQPVNPSAPSQRRSAAQRQSNPTVTTPPSQRSNVADKPKPSGPVAQHTSPSQPQQFPTARPVPGKPGYVYSLDPSGGYVDVSGYKSGSKAKDPYTQKIFIVP